MINLKGKVAVVTGGNSGIGFASAQKLKDCGARVVITGRSQERVKRAVEDLGVLGIVADVKDLSAIDHLVTQVTAEIGAIDILFVNAGIFAPAPVGAISEEMFDGAALNKMVTRLQSGNAPKLGAAFGASTPDFHPFSIVGSYYP